MRVALVDCLAAGRVGRRLSSVDVIGSGPRLVAGILKSLGVEVELFECSDVVEGRVGLGGFDVLMVSGMSSDIAS
ncbi:MAG: B12-binding domain-containing radical SAM protein, partial [Desulfurococcaceae archaeon]|nr:B12-binding domain-containing radical SAM protein [Desulfurococcaceae archaeon]